MTGDEAPPAPVRGAAAATASADARYYLRVTLVVAFGMIAGAILQWAPAEPSPWRWLPLGIAYLVGGRRIALDSWRQLRDEHRLSIDFLMGAAAIGAAVVGSPFEGTVLIFLFSLSNTLEHYAMGRTRSAIAKLMDLRPREATLVDGNGHETGRIPVDDLVPGQLVLVRPGERIAADGVVRSGRSDVDQAAITGESVPVTKTTGDEVFAGTIAQGGSLIVDVTRRTDETMLARIVRLVEEAQEQRAPAQHFIDRFAHPYTIAVVLATALVAVIPPWLFGVPWGDAFYRAMTLLVVGSPCALVISTPSAILSGIANGARHGILFKGGAYLDLAGSIDTVAFDKTGTLTIGRPRLMAIATERSAVESSAEAVEWGESPTDEELELLRAAAAVELTAEHHTARAIVEAAREHLLEVPPVAEFEALVGEGVVGVVDGARIWVGNEKLVARMGARVSPALVGWSAEQLGRARSVVYVGEGKGVLGAMAFGDALKHNAAATVRHLKYEGIRWITILSGDHPLAVRAIASELGADEVRAGLLPHEKVDAVRSLGERSRGVAMVGDGVNDAPAMAAATLGVAMGAAGTDVAIETSDVVLMSDDVEKIDYVIHLGKRARRVVRQNVFFSVGWMLLLVVIALFVGIPLTLAVVAHEGSTLIVVLNGLRLLGGRPHPPVVPRERPVHLRSARGVPSRSAGV
ncbi:MAG TPA: cation-translocating P-type ATPase [Gemmatimonadaceae bacterium]|nr:cation-translocating P-type ATPase [Gemmatimonadaceae bacterium]